MGLTIIILNHLQSFIEARHLKYGMSGFFILHRTIPVNLLMRYARKVKPAFIDAWLVRKCSGDRQIAKKQPKTGLDGS